MKIEDEDSNGEDNGQNHEESKQAS